MIEPKNDHFGLQMLFMTGKAILFVAGLLLVCKLIFLLGRLVPLAESIGERTWAVAVLLFIGTAFYIFSTYSFWAIGWLLNTEHASNFQKLLRKMFAR